MPAIDADLAKAQPGTESAAGRVLRKDPRDQLPEATSFGVRDQPRERQPAHALPARGSRDVDGHFGNTRVRRARPVLASPGERDNDGSPLDDDGRIAVGTGGEQRG